MDRVIPALWLCLSSLMLFMERKLPLFGIWARDTTTGATAARKTFKMKFGHHGGNHPVMT